MAVKENKSNIDLEAISDKDLLETRISDLPLKIEGTWLAECIAQLYAELDQKGIIFKPECYLADEWLTPKDETCIGIPFFLAHPRLIRLEKDFMAEAEGETRNWCMKLLRHETGHALSYAYKLHQRKSWQKIFGSSEEAYEDTYKYRAYSKNFVRHLDGYYAQYHPDEDFVETFSVWLTPELDWTARYKGWGALKKLKYVDKLMQEIKGKEPPVKSKVKYWRLSTLRYTLAHYYKKKKYLLAEEFPDFHDPFLKKIFFTPGEENKKWPSAFEVIAEYKKDILVSISRCCGEKKYIVNDLIKGLQKRCQQLKLKTSEDEAAIVIALSAYLASLTMNYLYTGRFRGSKRKIK